MYISFYTQYFSNEYLYCTVPILIIRTVRTWGSKKSPHPNRDSTFIFWTDMLSFHLAVWSSDSWLWSWSARSSRRTRRHSSGRRGRPRSLPASRSLQPEPEPELELKRRASRTSAATRSPRPRRRTRALWRRRWDEPRTSSWNSTQPLPVRPLRPPHSESFASPLTTLALCCERICLVVVLGRCSLICRPISFPVVYSHSQVYHPFHILVYVRWIACSFVYTWEISIVQYWNTGTRRTLFIVNVVFIVFYCLPCGVYVINMCSARSRQKRHGGDARTGTQREGRVRSPARRAHQTAGTYKSHIFTCLWNNVTVLNMYLYRVYCTGENSYMCCSYIARCYVAQMRTTWSQRWTRRQSQEQERRLSIALAYE